MNHINTIIHEVRAAISEVAISHDCSDEKLVDFLSVKNIDDYSSIIDSFYLLEDTQVAKQHFMNQELVKQEFGCLYLFFYGVLNACYMQQQSIFVIYNKLNLSINRKKIQSLKVFDYRNSFSAHSSNRGKGKEEHSFILDRYAMREGLVKGYSSNNNQGIVFKEAKIHNLINEWDQVLKQHLETIKVRILNTH